MGALETHTSKQWRGHVRVINQWARRRATIAHSSRAAPSRDNVLSDVLSRDQCAPVHGLPRNESQCCSKASSRDMGS